MSGSAPLHKLPPVGKDCCAEAAALLRNLREQADQALRSQLREDIARGLEIFAGHLQEAGASAEVEQIVRRLAEEVRSRVLEINGTEARARS